MEDAQLRRMYELPILHPALLEVNTNNILLMLNFGIYISNCFDKISNSSIRKLLGLTIFIFYSIRKTTCI